MESNWNLFKVYIKPLKAHNFFTWPNKVENALRGRRIWKYVDSEDSVTATFAGETELQKSDHVLAYILIYIGRSCKASRGAIKRSPRSMENSVENLFFSGTGSCWCKTNETATCENDE